MKNNATQTCEDCATKNAKYHLTLTDLAGTIVDSVWLCGGCAKEAAARTPLIVGGRVK